MLEWFCGRKIRTFPELTGDSSYLRLVHNDELVQLGRDIAARLGLAGIFKMDFKRNASTGRFYLLEINTRFNLWHYLGAASGVNLPRVAYDYLVHGQRAQHVEARVGKRWLCLMYDWRACKELAARGQISRGRWVASLLEAPKVYDLFAWSDPMPFARYWSGRIRAALARRMHRWHATAS